jgi:putative two-component system response regulator
MLAMIVDDSRSSLSHLQRIVEQASNVRAIPFLDPEAALLASTTRRFDMVIVDHIMPKVDGITFIRQMRGTDGHGQVPMIMLTATTDDAVRLAALEAGATDFLSKSQSPVELRVRLRNLIDLSNALRKLDDYVALQAREIEKATQALLAREEEMVFRLSKALEYRDNETNDHTLRVAKYSRMISERLGLSQQECRSMYLASPLHDIGKVAIPDGILLKPGLLDDDEREIINTHTEIGARILGESTSDLIKLAAQIAENHHERWDGKGYPKRLSGEDIPLCARIVAIADVFDALTTKRPYKKAHSTADALDILKAERGRHFDPACLDAFLAAYAEMEPLAETSEPSLPAPERGSPSPPPASASDPLPPRPGSLKASAASARKR